MQRAACGNNSGGKAPVARFATATKRQQQRRTSGVNRLGQGQMRGAQLNPDAGIIENAAKQALCCDSVECRRV